MDKKSLGEHKMEQKPEAVQQPVHSKDSVEYSSLEVHVALSERHEEIETDLTLLKHTWKK